MSKRPRSRSDLEEQFLEQFDFLRKSCDAYDAGDEMRRTSRRPESP